MKLLLMPLLGLCTSAAVWAQTATLRGRVIDERGRAVPEALVSLGEGSVYAQTDSLGSFALDGFAVGYYRLRVEAEGYAPLLSAELYLQAGQSNSIELVLSEMRLALGEVLVRSRSKMKMVAQPLSLLSLSLKDLERGAGFNRDVSKAMQTLPGVGITDTNRNDLLVRGGGPSENKFYLDGVEIPVINHFATQGASGGVVGLINPDFVEELNFYTSHLPARSKGLSSVMELRQRDGHRERLQTKLSLGASDASITLDGPLGARGSFIVSARQSYLQYLFKALKLPFLPTYNDFQLKYKHRLGERSQLSIIGLGAIDRMRLNTSLSASGSESQRYILGYLPEYRQANYTLGLVYKYFADNYTDTWVLSRNWLYNASEKYQGNDKSKAQMLDYRSSESENKLRFERLFSKLPLRLMLGGGLEYAHYTNDTKRLAYPAPETYNSRLGLWSYQLFAEASKSYFSDRLGVSLGLNLQGSSHNSEALNPLAQLSPRLALSYQIASAWQLRMGLARYYMLPAYTVLGFKSELGDYINKGSSYLRSDQLTLGAEYSPRQGYRFGAEAFYKAYDNYPVSVSDGISLASKGLDYGQVGDEAVRSVGKGRAYGMELYAYLQPSSRLKAVANYTYAHSSFTDISAVYRPSSWDTRHIVNTLFSYQMARGWFVSARWRYLGSAPYTPIDVERSSDRRAWALRGRAYLDYNQFNSLRLPATHQLDVRVDKDFYIGRSLLSFYIDVQNVYAGRRAQAPIYTNLDEQGNIMLDPLNPSEKQKIRQLEGAVAARILPTIGVIFKY